ncbi:hypothetical protein TB1_001994 [Malus domestica]
MFEAEHLDHTLEDDHLARDPEDVILLLAVLLRRLVEEYDEDWVVQEIGADHEPLYLVVDVDRDVALGTIGSPAEDLRRRSFTPNDSFLRGQEAASADECKRQSCEESATRDSTKIWDFEGFCTV